ncbi:MAG TPA: ABC transporter permease [Patescibacteria group bacterium]|nr:ABC transporter permease [Patescibacteria group bacterium]
MRVIYLARKDLLQIIRDWKAAFFLVVMPIAFTLLFGFAFGGSGDETSDPRLPVGYLDNDDGSLSPYLLELLNSSEVIRLETEVMEETTLEERVGDEELAAAVIVPRGFGEQWVAGKPIPLVVYLDNGNTSGRAVEGEVSAASSRLAAALQTADFSVAVYQDRLDFPGPAEQEAYFLASLEKALGSWDDPPVTLSSSASAKIIEDDSSVDAAIDANPYAHTSPGMMAQFAIAGLMGASAVIVLERKNRALSRLLTTPISRAGILLGHYLAMFVMIFGQLVILVLFAQLFLDLNFYREPLATLLVMGAAAIFSASLGLLIGAVAKSEDQVVILGLIPMFILAGLGGAWVPLEFTPENFQKIARLTPLAWVIDGFQDIIIRGQGLETVWVAGAALLAYSMVLIALALWRFRFE